ncbi:hypothetical protein ACT4UT_26310, partial [Bacillus sp. B-TM1]
MREMKKLVKIATSLTLMGGIFVSANGVSANTDVTQKSSPNIMIEFDDVTTVFADTPFALTNIPPIKVSDVAIFT